ncbi:hypothetical protein E1N52_27170 [Paraburkholderia guartelaensis]|uniref:Uncharacterized protein n=1 Tax=Paraburkholderia guartelaensis TaxID=2546446 RepID=A0A4R5L858_9BURK|nr:hypothetical protein [Paraburkholderia guartelaensis]TDG05118.1 hypothetical protein E1N52_27170 [Paraburkholderia guartelaensis]
MRYAMRKAVIRFIFLELLTVIVFSAIAYSADNDIDWLPRFVSELGDLYRATWFPHAFLVLFDVLHKFLKSYCGPLPSGSSSSGDDDTGTRRQFDDWPDNRPEFNTNGSIMHTFGTDATGHIRGDTHL